MKLLITVLSIILLPVTAVGAIHEVLSLAYATGRGIVRRGITRTR